MKSRYTKHLLWGVNAGIVLTAFMMVSSCGLYKKYERTEMGFVDSLYRRMDIGPGDTVSTASVSWDKMFTDPLLQEWINLPFPHPFLGTTGPYF